MTTKKSSPAIIEASLAAAADARTRALIAEALAPILARLDVLESLAGKLSRVVQHEQPKAIQRAVAGAYAKIATLEERLGISSSKPKGAAAPAPATEATEQTTT